MPQNMQGAMAVRSVQQREGDDANGREAGADHQCVGQHHGQVFTQRRRQGVTAVNRDHQRHQPRPQFAQGKAQHVHSLGMLRQFFAQAKTQAYAVADPDQQGCQQAPDHDDQGEGKNDRQPLTCRQHQGHQFVLGQANFPGPARGGAVCARELFFKVGKGAADQAQNADFSFGLGFFCGVAQFFQVSQQLAALLVVFEIFDHLVQRLAQRLGRLRLGFI